MGKSGEQRDKKESKRAIKDKKKFKNRNSFGKAKKKNGSVGRYMTRTQAVNHLQAHYHAAPHKCYLSQCLWAFHR